MTFDVPSTNDRINPRPLFGINILDSPQGGDGRILGMAGSDNLPVSRGPTDSQADGWTLPITSPASRASPREFFGLLRQNFVAAMGGGASVLAALVAAYMPTIPNPKLVAAVAIVGGVLSAYGIWAKERNRRAEIEHLLSQTPDLQVGPGGFYEATRYISPADGSLDWRHKVVRRGRREIIGVEASFLYLRVTNRPSGVPTERSDAYVSARIHFYNNAGDEKFATDGRWSDAIQPPALPPSQAVAELQRITIGAGQTRDLDIAMMYPGRESAYAFSNDSYQSLELCNVLWRLGQGDHVARVEVIGPYVRRAWKLTFRVGERLATLGCESVPI